LLIQFSQHFIVWCMEIGPIIRPLKWDRMIWALPLEAYMQQGREASGCSGSTAWLIKADQFRKGLACLQWRQESWRSINSYTAAEVNTLNHSIYHLLTAACSNVQMPRGRTAVRSWRSQVEQVQSSDLSAGPQVKFHDCTPQKRFQPISPLGNP
jgi:hypothetical protein